MRTKLFTLIAFILVSMSLSGCGGTTSNSKDANTNVTKENTNNLLETTKSTPEPVKNNAPTLTPVFKAYCEAKIKNDEAALRKIYSQGTLKHFEAEMKEEKVKSLLKFLEIDKVSEKLCEITNEKITGDRAVARIRYDSYPNGIEIVFVKEDGEWKMTDESPTFEAVKASNSNKTSTK